MPSIFSRIISGEIPSYKIAENGHCFSFLDVKPLIQGHALIIPKKEIDYIFDIDDDLYLELHRFAKKIALAIHKAIPCKKVGMAVIGLEVPHAHIHLVPMQDLHTLNFSNERKIFTPEEYFETLRLIQAHL